MKRSDTSDKFVQCKNKK